MSKEQHHNVDQLLRTSPLDVGGAFLEQRRLFLDLMSAPLPEDVCATNTMLGALPALEITVCGSDPNQFLLWFHGGFYVFGSPATSAMLAASVARRTDARVISVDYRLAPEHPYPAAVEDAVDAYKSLLASDTNPARVAFVGESAGAGLVVAALTRLRTDGCQLPACAVLFSPYADATLSGASVIGKQHVEPAFTAAQVRVRAADYLGSADPANPEISPVNANLTGLPPLLIQVGTHEILLDDATRLATRAAADDVAVILDVTPGVPHLFQMFASILDEGERALQRVERFLLSNWGIP